LLPIPTGLLEYIFTYLELQTKKHMNRLIIPSCCILLFSSCATTSTLPKYQLRDDHYTFHQPGGGFTEVYADVEDDTIKVIAADKTPVAIDLSQNQLFLKPSFDVDVLVTLFKYRPSSQGLPRQLTADFNGNIYLGYRLDRFRVHYVKTPLGQNKHIRHKAISLGVFGGIGSTSITPWTTNQGTPDEYNGFILTRGVALMFGVNNLTVGIGTGWDYLTDRDKDIWIYQNKVWYGMTLSLNLN
jgi:hypothetical protein